MRTTESISDENGLYHDVNTEDYSEHSPDCKYCETRKREEEKK